MDFAFKKICLAILLLIFMSSGCNRQQSPDAVLLADNLNAQYNRELQIKDKILRVEIITTAVSMAKGLSNRPSMEQDQGMLFDFSNYPNAVPTFWMKDMKFNLDLIWIKDKKIISITKNAPRPADGAHDNQLPTYSPPATVDAVLEVNAGWAEENKIEMGDEVRMNDKN